MTSSNDPAQRPDEPAAVGLLELVRRNLSDVSLPLALPGAEQARLEVRNAIAQLDDYILPRYRSLDAPLLAVVGGSTGAGKSTLVNACTTRRKPVGSSQCSRAGPDRRRRPGPAP